VRRRKEPIEKLLPEVRRRKKRILLIMEVVKFMKKSANS
jgi:hypothetical protein